MMETIDRRAGTNLLGIYGAMGNEFNKFIKELPNRNLSQWGEMVGGLLTAVVSTKGVEKLIALTRVTKTVGKAGSFGKLMEAGEAARYTKYWESYAPNQISPGTTRLDWTRISGRTGQIEKSRVIYDGYGR